LVDELKECKLIRETAISNSEEKTYFQRVLDVGLFTHRLVALKKTFNPENNFDQDFPANRINTAQHNLFLAQTKLEAMTREICLWLVRQSPTTRKEFEDDDPNGFMKYFNNPKAQPQTRSPSTQTSPAAQQDQRGRKPQRDGSRGSAPGNAENDDRSPSQSGQGNSGKKVARRE
jgi:hypothetical protein